MTQEQEAGAVCDTARRGEYLGNVEYAVLLKAFEEECVKAALLLRTGYNELAVTHAGTRDEIRRELSRRLAVRAERSQKEVSHASVKRLDEMGEPFPRALWDPRPGELGIVRGLGFNTEYYLDGTREEVFFIGPALSSGTERAENCSEESAQEFIAYYEHQIETMKLYLLNGRNRKTHEWTVKVSAPEKPAVQP